MTTFVEYLKQRGVEPRLTKDGKPDKRNPQMRMLECEWLRATLIGEDMMTKSAIEPKKETCPVCYEELDESKVVTQCNHVFCVSCFTQAVRESDACSLCRAPLSNVVPKIPQPMGPQVSQQMLGLTLNELIGPMVIEMYETIYHDIAEMEKKLQDMPNTTRNQKEKGGEIRLVESNKILQMISERYMIFGYNILARSNMWHTGDIGYPRNPMDLVVNLPHRVGGRLQSVD